jgi:DNA-binding CsgD family transcriptional regulator
MAGGRPRLIGHGLTQREAEVMELRDGGMSVVEIAAAMGLRVSSVRAIITRYIGDDRCLRERSIRLATQRLGAAVANYMARHASPVCAEDKT